MDADVRLHPKAIQAIVETLENKQLGDAEFIWYLDSGRFLGKGLVPAVGWLIRGAVDFR